MTVRDVRLHWPAAEKALKSGSEILVTRDGQPVARLLPYVPPANERRERFDANLHLDWLARFWGRKDVGPTTGDLLARDRAD